MTDQAVPTLSELFARLAGELEGVVSDRSGGLTAYARGARQFAAVHGEAVEIRLQPEVAEAALRTPHTQASARGEGWVRLAPPEVDRFVIDRAEAWFVSAWRAAGR